MPSGQSQATICLAWLCLLPSLYVCQRRDQTYILIRPRTLVLSQKAPEGAVQIVCRQLPLSTSVSGRSLTLRRRPSQQGQSGGSDEMVAELMAGSTAKVPDSQNEVSGDVNRELVVTLTAASCRDADYVYTCHTILTNGQNNTFSATFAVSTPAAQISIRAQPSRRIYSKKETVILTCSSGENVVGISDSAGAQTRWVWEYSDGGRWMPADRPAVSGGTVESSGDCFQKASPTSLRVILPDLKMCARRFRCYIQRGTDTAVDNAKEFLVSAGFSCNEDFKVLGTDPVVAIIGVIAVVVVFCMIAYGLFQVSRRVRRRQKEKCEREMKMRILSPMNPAQRDRLLKEKMAKQDMEKPSPRPPPPEPPKTLTTLTEPTSELNIRREAESEEEEEEEEEEDMESSVDMKKKKWGLKVIVEAEGDSVASEEITDEGEEPYTSEDPND